MFCLEVFRNGERLCRAGIGEFGMLDAMVIWHRQDPERMARLRAQGWTGPDPVPLELSLSGAVNQPEGLEHLEWLKLALEVGDEVRVLVLEADEADPPVSRHIPEDPTRGMMEKFVRSHAEGLGWKIRVPGSAAGARRQGRGRRGLRRQSCGR
jgi:hypothetical protein